MAGYGPRRLQTEGRSGELPGEGVAFCEGARDDVFTGELPRIVAGVVLSDDILRDPAAYRDFAAQVGQLLDQGREELLVG